MGGEGVMVIGYWVIGYWLLVIGESGAALDLRFMSFDL